MNDRERQKHSTYLRMAQAAAFLSKDPSTRVGALVLDRRGVVRGTGYNGFAMGVVDRPEWLADRETKLLVTRHAEVNALWAAGPDAEGGTIYVTHHPCAGCAADIVQHGIRRVVIPVLGRDLGGHWARSIELAQQQFADVGIEVIEV